VADLSPIEIDRLVLPAFRAWHRDGFLLAAGNFAAGTWNCMTVGWGGLGCLWDRPVAVVGARPTRYTVEFLQRFPGFTLCHFPAGHRKALMHLGTHSGRDGDKVGQSGLTPVASTAVAAPSFAEADLVIECVQVYADDYRPEAALSEELRSGARSGRGHRLFFGEVRAILGAPGYASAQP
jgi:flavin reductase (DIM6/NTAB) family NADH-FMN oxidoreductase RutF